MRTLVIFAMMLTVVESVESFCVPSSKADSLPAPAMVVKVVDGDTIDIRGDERGRLRVRVLGIDTPETKKPGYSVGCYGPQASAFARDMLEGKRITWWMDPSQDVYDRYGRTLAYVFLPDGTNYSVAAAAGGYARSFVYQHRPSRYASDIAAAEQGARTAGRGLWGPPCQGHTTSVPT